MDKILKLDGHFYYEYFTSYGKLVNHEHVM